MVSTPGADICKEESRQKAEMQVQGRSRVPPHMGARVRELLAQSREIEGVHVHTQMTRSGRACTSPRDLSPSLFKLSMVSCHSVSFSRARTHTLHICIHQLLSLGCARRVRARPLSDCGEQDLRRHPHALSGLSLVALHLHPPDLAGVGAPARARRDAHALAHLRRDLLVGHAHVDVCERLPGARMPSEGGWAAQMSGGSRIRGSCARGLRVPEGVLEVAPLQAAARRGAQRESHVLRVDARACGVGKALLGHRGHLHLAHLHLAGRAHRRTVLVHAGLR